MFKNKLEIENEVLKVKLEMIQTQCERLEEQCKKLESQAHEAYMALMSKEAPAMYYDKIANPALKEARDEAFKSKDILRQFAEMNESERVIDSYNDLKETIGKALIGIPPKSIHGPEES